MPYNVQLKYKPDYSHYRRSELQAECEAFHKKFEVFAEKEIARRTAEARKALKAQADGLKNLANDVHEMKINDLLDIVARELDQEDFCWQLRFSGFGDCISRMMGYHRVPANVERAYKALRTAVDEWKKDA